MGPDTLLRSKVNELRRFENSRVYSVKGTLAVWSDPWMDLYFSGILWLVPRGGSANYATSCCLCTKLKTRTVLFAGIDVTLWVWLSLTKLNFLGKFSDRVVCVEACLHCVLHHSCLRYTERGWYHQFNSTTRVFCVVLQSCACANIIRSFSRSHSKYYGWK